MSGAQTKNSFYKFNKISDNLKIIKRSSALFLLKHSQKQKIFTELHFLNYWKVKRNLTSLKAKLNIRELNGSKLLSKDINIHEMKSYCIKLNQLLSENNIKEFTGTVEIEIFSEKNMFVPFPAVIVRYYGKNWHTGLHSTARYFSESSGDNINVINNEQTSNESNITLFSKKNINCYIVLHNGLISSTNTQILLTATNYKYKKIKKKLEPIDMKKGETLILCIDEYLDYKNFLNGKRGMLTVHYQSKGVFPRIMYYHQGPSGEISVEHSSFGDSESAMEDIFEVKKNERNLLFSMPIFPKDYKTEIDIFPTYPNQSTPYTVICKKNNFNGEQLSIKKIKIPGLEPHCQLSEKGSADTTFLDMNFLHDKKLPNRFHTNLYYSKNNSLPGIILDGPFPRHYKPPHTRWAPFFNDEKKLRTKIYICGRYFDANEKNGTANMSISLYGCTEKEKVSFVKSMKNNQNLELDISEILKGKKWKSNYGWIYIKFEERNFCNVYFASEYMNNSIMCNHAF